MRKMSIISCVVVVILFLIAAPAFSQGQERAGKEGTGKHQGDIGPCKADLEKYCKGIKPGEGRLRACLKGNSDRLSQACKDHLTSMQQQRKDNKGHSEFHESGSYK